MLTKKSTPASRERNRVHARKTRQRKKEQMQSLQNRAEDLKKEHIRLKQIINEKTTARILLGLVATVGSKECNMKQDDPRVERLLHRPVEDIPDASKITELPALILPGQHNSKKALKLNNGQQSDHIRNDGIDYVLLGKDRSQCSPEELDKIRRERNRMHAKRTRDRKRLFMEEMTEMCKQIENDNAILREHLENLDGDKASSSPSDIPSVSPRSPIKSSALMTDTPAREITRVTSDSGCSSEEILRGTSPKKRRIGDHIVTLLEVAGAFDKSTESVPRIIPFGTSGASAVSASTNSTSCEVSCDDHDDNSNSSQCAQNKRRILFNGRTKSATSTVPYSITTSPNTIGA